MKVTAILKGLIDSNGHRPVQIRVHSGNQRTYFATGIKVNPELFEKGKVKPKHPKSKELNDRLNTLIIQKQAQALEPPKKYPKTSFYEYYEKVYGPTVKAEGTQRQYASQITKLKEYSPELYLHSINHEWLDNYKKYLVSIGNEDNTVWNGFKFVRAVIRRAFKQKRIPEYPFDGYDTPKYKETDPDYLTKEELKRWEKFAFKATGKVRESAIWFLIACHTGQRIQDLKRFDKGKNIIGDRLVWRMMKGGELIGIPLLPRVIKYYEAIGYKKLSFHENTYRDLLKLIAMACEIDKDISTHTARHTAAMLLVEAGVRREVIAKILGHKDLRATAVYAKIKDAIVDADYKKALK